MRVSIVLPVLLALCSSAFSAQPNYPAKPIRFIVPYPPGGGTDIVARTINMRLAERLGQSVIVDNRGGANAIIGTNIAAKAPADGYTLLMCLQASMAVNPGLYRNLPYDPIRDFAPVLQLTKIAQIMTVHPGLPVKTVKELIQLARKQPGKLTYASSGTGGSSHLATALFTTMAKLDMVHVPYKGGGPAVNDIVAGQVNVYAGTVLSLIQFVKSGRVRALGVTTEKRLASLPDVPTIGESLPGYEAGVWQGLVVPAGTPRAIVERLNREVNEILKMPDIHARLTAGGAEPVGGTSAAFGSFIKADTIKVAKLIKEAGIKVQ
jgi:tripartite-type tricarboxylate transporter receptor subunit TctC